MTISNKDGLPRIRRRGFSLVEIMVTVGLFSVILAAIIPAFNFFGRSVIGLGNYSAMSQESRRSMEILSRDIHAAEALTEATEHELTLILPNDLGGDTVNFRYSSADKTVVRTVTPLAGAVSSQEILTDVGEFSFIFFNRLGNELEYSHGPILIETKSIQVNAKQLKKVIQRDTSDYIVSARYLMRNH